MPDNRKLNIEVTFHVTDVPTGFGGNATYRQTGSTPSDMGDLVDSDGTIHLDNAASYDKNQYNQNVDLEFTLLTPCTGAHSFTVAWATQYAPGMTTAPPPGGGTPGELQIVTSSTNPNVISIIDKDDDNKHYNYCPNIEIIRPGQNNYKIAVDPQIVNREIN